MRIQRWIFGSVALFVMLTPVTFTPVATAGDTLIDLLREKGVITKEDWIRLKAAEAKQEVPEPQKTKTPVATTGDALTDLLREKGVITKEEWIRLKTAEKKQEVPEQQKVAEQQEAKKKSGVEVGFGKKGFTLATRDGLFKTKIQWRFQGRYTYPERSDPRNKSAFEDNEESSFELRRMRMKVGGHGYKPWITYYFEVDWQHGRDYDDGASASYTRLLDWRIMLEKFKWAKLRIGQWKINYSRERVDSSGKQTMVERSIMNRVFTIDRQIGMMVYGRVNPGTILDSNYYLGMFSGGGRGLSKNDDDNMMYVGRLQWNVFGRELKWRQSDVTFHKKPTGSVSFGAYTTKGKCTRWSSSGCGNVSGFTRPADARDGQFQVRGTQVGSAFKYRGFAWQHETHWKHIKDTQAAAGERETDMFGGYFQAGYFPHYLIPALPKPLEVAFRYSHVDPNTDAPGDFRQEFTTGFNWFFAGHRNKLTLDASHLTLEHEDGTARDYAEQRVRLQWDVSF